ncbi:MAG TPA: hypothetical protein VHO03_17045 [Ignavibacteriales bacterium]|nr:hypothetical protein [Ignavibacteriales bacterium]
MTHLMFALVFSILFAIRDGLVNRQLDFYRRNATITEDKSKGLQRISDGWHSLGYFRNAVIIGLWACFTHASFIEICLILSTFALLSDGIINLLRGRKYDQPVTVDSKLDWYDWIFETLRSYRINPLLVKILLFIGFLTGVLI